MISQYVPELAALGVLLAVAYVWAVVVLVRRDQRLPDDGEDIGVDLVTENPIEGERRLRYRGHRREQRVIRHGRRPVSRPRLPAEQRDTVEVRVIDPPERGGGRG